MRGTERPGLGAVIAGANREAVAVSEPSPGAATRAACGAVRVYQRAFAGRLSPCRFWPTCSNYALDALLAHGFWRGSWLTTRRLARCHPWGGQGVDPVPERGGR